jgi:hypothetical protein
MAPGEEDYEELGSDVFIRNVEIVLQGRDVDVAIELSKLRVSKETEKEG